MINASPDVHAQLEAIAPSRSEDVRESPIAGALLTDAEIDHTAGLLLMRESSSPVRVFGSAEVGRALRDVFPVLSILDRYCGVEWQTLDPGCPSALEGSSLVVEPFLVGGDAPRYLGGSDALFPATGFVFSDRAGRGVATCVPGLSRLDDAVLSRFAISDLVLVDGTFWSDDELPSLGISSCTAGELGHVPLSGGDGMLAALARLERPRKALIHINNTNPVLLEDSPEREAVRRASVEVAYDGLEIEL